MGLADGKKMYHLLIRNSETGREVPMESLADSEEAALEAIPNGFTLVRYLDRYWWPLGEMPSDPPHD